MLCQSIETETETETETTMKATTATKENGLPSFLPSFSALLPTFLMNVPFVVVVGDRGTVSDAILVTATFFDF